MRRTLAALILSLALTAPAHAQLVITGRDAQALHCAAMLFMVSSLMFDAGHISRNARDNAQGAALIMLDKVPGTDDQRLRAMAQRFDSIMQSRTPQQLVDEYSDTARWCRANLLP